MAKVTLFNVDTNVIGLPFQDETVEFILPVPPSWRPGGIDLPAPGPGITPIPAKKPRTPRRPPLIVQPGFKPLAAVLKSGSVVQAHFFEVNSPSDLDLVIDARRQPDPARPQDLIISLGQRGIDIDYATEKLTTLSDDTRVSLVTM